MTGLSRFPSRSLKNEYARWIERIDPNVVVTLTLNQAVRSEGPKGPVWQRGDRIVYGGVFKGLIKRLSRRLYGRKRTDRGAIIPCVGVVEGDGQEKLFHIHFVVRRPDDISFEEFRLVLLSICLSGRWIKPDIDIQERTGNFVGYMLKEGFDAILIP